MQTTLKTINEDFIPDNPVSCFIPEGYCISSNQDDKNNYKFGRDLTDDSSIVILVNDSLKRVNFKNQITLIDAEGNLFKIIGRIV